MIDTLTPRERQVYEGILATVTAETGVSTATIEGPSRPIHACAARKLAAWRLRRAGLSFASIGRGLGGREKATAMYLVETYDPSTATVCIPIDVEADDHETPSQARARVARQLATGERCPACHLLLPCGHEQARAA